jgi:hypothetical protein
LFAQKVTVKIKVSGEEFSTNPIPVLAVHDQIIELPANKDGATKHMLGGRITIRVVRHEWGGPFIEIMPRERREKYVKSFRSFDLDGSGTIDPGFEPPMRQSPKSSTVLYDPQL